MKNSERTKRYIVSSKHWFLLLSPLFVLFLANAMVAAAVEGVIYPGIKVAGQNVSGLTRQQAVSLLQAKPLGKQLTLTVAGKEFVASNEQIGASYNVPATVELAYQTGRQHKLPLVGVIESLRKPQDLGYAYKLDYRKLSAFTNQIVGAVGRPATNAALVIENGQTSVQPDSDGVGLNKTEVTQLVSSALSVAENGSFTLETEPVEAPIQAEAVETVKTEANSLLQRSIRLTYEGRTFQPSPLNIGYWVTTAPNDEVNPTNLRVAISEEQIKGYVQSVANEIDKAPVNKKVVVKNGASSVEREGQDGVALNQEAAVAEIVKAMRENRDAEIALTTTSVVFKTETTRTTSLDASKYIEVNLAKQYMWAYENGQVVHSAPVTSGATGAGLGTATGLFAIYSKQTNTYLNGRPYGYDYNVFVTYWMPFYKGYGLHDASWRNGRFGGSDYYYGGSHGCVNLPYGTAAFLYAWSDIGTPVWVHN
jgi:lipoprotein-anchoring transpeptidase ErfK/SrfK